MIGFSNSLSFFGSLTNVTNQRIESDMTGVTLLKPMDLWYNRVAFIGFSWAVPRKRQRGLLYVK